MNHWTKALPKDACTVAVDWCKTQPDLATAWQVCERGDWMLWLAGKYSGPAGDDRRRPLVLAACECARLTLDHVPVDDERPRLAIETAERWARGEGGVTLEDVNMAADAAAAYYAAAAAVAAAAYAAAAAYYAAAAAVAAAYYADADDAATASDAAYAATASDAAYAATASDAAYAATYAADAAYAAYAATRAATLKACAAIVRKHYPTFSLGDKP